MDKNDIIRMAREAWLSDYGATVFSSGEDVEVALEDIERFADLVAAAEREACAKVCEEAADLFGNSGHIGVCITNAGAIRARGNQ